MRHRVGTVLLLVAALCLPLPAAQAASRGSELRAGQTLNNGDRLVSPSGQRTLDLDRAVGETEGLLVDTIGLDLSTDGCGPTYVDSTVDIELQHSTLRMQGDGNLVWYRGPYAIMNSGTAGNPGAFARMQDDGNFVVYSRSGRALWHLENPCTFLIAASYVDDQPVHAYLRPGWFMQDENRRYRLQMQTDGNLVLIGPRGRPVWNSRTHGNPGAYLAKQTDGNLVIYSAAGRPLWNTRTARGGDVDSFLMMENTGNVVLYQDGRDVWATRTAGRS